MFLLQYCSLHIIPKLFYADTDFIPECMRDSMPSENDACARSVKECGGSAFTGTFGIWICRIVKVAYVLSD
jgi:hypothetical protein